MTVFFNSRFLLRAAIVIACPGREKTAYETLSDPWLNTYIHKRYIQTCSIDY
jgi:hypothetical protein